MISSFVDLNDNSPVFPTLKYNISLREGVIPKAPIISIVATDLDSGKFGQITYAISKGNEDGKFHINKLTGEVFAQSPLSKSNPLHIITISATDGGGLVSEKNAELKISVVDMKQQSPVFQNARYTFSIDEDAPINSLVGSVLASGHSLLLFSFFSISLLNTLFYNQDFMFMPASYCEQVPQKKDAIVKQRLYYYLKYVGYFNNNNKLWMDLLVRSWTKHYKKLICFHFVSFSLK